MTKKVEKWVEIEKTILTPKERSNNIPAETKKINYVMRVNGFLIKGKPVINSTVQIKTLSGRLIDGRLVELNPGYNHSYGNMVAELLNIKR